MKKGFTLIELMIVVVIIGILAAIAIPKFQAVKKAEQAEVYVTGMITSFTHNTVTIVQVSGSSNIETPSKEYKIHSTYEFDLYDSIQATAEGDSIIAYEMVEVNE